MAFERKMRQNAEHAIRETMKQFADKGLAWVNYYLGDDHDGEASVFFLIVLKHDERMEWKPDTTEHRKETSEFFHEIYRPIEQNLHRLVDNFEYGYHSYTDVRLESEFPVEENKEWRERWARPAFLDVSALPGSADGSASVRSRSGTAISLEEIESGNGLDRIDVYLCDYSPGRGSITITCYGAAWTAWFGAMGGGTIRTFVNGADTGYLVNKLFHSPQLKQRKCDLRYLSRIVEAVKSHLARSANEPSRSVDKTEESANI